MTEAHSTPCTPKPLLFNGRGISQSTQALGIFACLGRTVTLNFSSRTASIDCRDAAANAGYFEVIDIRLQVSLAWCSLVMLFLSSFRAQLPGIDSPCRHARPSVHTASQRPFRLNSTDTRSRVCTPQAVRLGQRDVPDRNLEYACIGFRFMGSHADHFVLKDSGGWRY